VTWSRQTYQHNFWFVKANGALKQEWIGHSYAVVLLRKLKV